METTIYLIRHAQTECNASGRFQGWADIELNECGYDQAEKVASRLKFEPVDAIYTSPLNRASTTAALIAALHKMTPVSLPELAEINYGEWEGRSREDVAAIWPDLLVKMRTDPSGVTIPGGESFEDFSERATAAFRKVVTREEGKKVVMVSHSGIIKALVLNIIGVENAMWGKIEIANTSITTVQITSGIARLVSLNDVTHLSSKELKNNVVPMLSVA